MKIVVVAVVVVVYFLYVLKEEVYAACMLLYWYKFYEQDGKGSNNQRSNDGTCLYVYVSESLEISANALMQDLWRQTKKQNVRTSFQELPRQLGR